MRGKSGYVPFWPGGLDNIKPVEDDTLEFVEGSSQLRTVAPGLSRGLRVPGQNQDEIDLDVIGLRPNTRMPLEDEDALVSLVIAPVSLSHC